MNLATTSRDDASAPRVASAHRFDAGGTPMVFSVARGTIAAVDGNLSDLIETAMLAGDDDRVQQLMAMAGILDRPLEMRAPESVPLKALSLAVAQKCNMGCTYCYADQGNFGGADRGMSEGVALAAVDRLLAEAAPGGAVCLAFMGGEPLMNRSVLKSATRWAVERAAQTGVRVSFALTTNATLITPEDASFFEAHAFTITVSLDGSREVHDLLRPFKSGRGSHERVVAGARLLLGQSPRRSRVIARVTVTPRNVHIGGTVDELRALGFDGIQLAPMLRSPSGGDQLGTDDLAHLLSEMIACGRAFKRALLDGEHYPFLNVINTLRRIHERGIGAYPCGAGGGYMGVSATGKLYACHRFVGDRERAMGDVGAGIDRPKQTHWIALRHVDAQQPCQSCWARYLCGGSCHYDAINGGRHACDYIRGWLHACLGLYVELQRECPELLARAFEALPPVE